MPPRQILPYLKDLLARDELAEFFELLTPRLETNPLVMAGITVSRNKLITAERNYYILHLIDYPTFSLQKNQAIIGLHNAVDSLGVESVIGKNKEGIIEESILLLSPSLDSEKEMLAYLPFDYFPKLQTAQEEDYQQIANSFKIIIFDYFDHNGIIIESEIRSTQTNKLQWLLKNTDCYIIWFGTHNDMVRENSDRIYAANFRFALYARIREMIDFLKYYSGEKPS